MSPGLPSAGAMFLFYVLTALWMPLRELALALRGQSSGTRWPAIRVQVMLALGSMLDLFVKTPRQPGARWG